MGNTEPPTLLTSWPGLHGISWGGPGHGVCQEYVASSDDVTLNFQADMFERGGAEGKPVVIAEFWGRALGSWHSWLSFLQSIAQVHAIFRYHYATCSFAALGISWKPPGEPFSWIHPDYLYQS